MKLRLMAGRNEGVTLAEVAFILVVLGILAAILFPILRNCRSRFSQAKCCSNMRQLGKALIAYSQDWNGRWACPGGLIGDRTYWAQSGRGGIRPYVQCNGGLNTIWCCPELNEWRGKYPPRSYGMNSYLRDPADWEWIDADGHPLGITIIRGIQECTIFAPSRTILLYEGISETKPTVWAVAECPGTVDHIDRCGNWTQVRGWFTRLWPKNNSIDSTKAWHGVRNNYCYVDGHVASRIPNQYPSAPPKDCTNEWYVMRFRNVPKGKAIF